jgi:DnaJ-domain-containing protein 1
MSNILNYLWLILLAIYIISPFDAHPLFLDDLIASGLLFYMVYKNAKRKKQQQQYYDYYKQSESSRQTSETESKGPLTLDDACRLLGVSPNSSLDDITKAYKEKMIKSHPDKVSHLSEELQEKAKELTLKLNEAYDLIKKYKK